MSSSSSSSAAAREAILQRIRAGLRRGSPDPATRRVLELRTTDRHRNLIPARVDLGPQGLVALFAEMAEKMAAIVLRTTPDGVGEALAQHLAELGLPPEALRSPDPALDQMRMEPMALRHGMPDGREPVVVTGATVGIAETGTLAIASGAHHPTSFNFLPDIHAVVLPESRVVASYEDALDQIRGATGALPRTVNFITGPSRTGDIEQRLEMGAHGPRRLVILLVRDDPAAAQPLPG